MLTDPFDDEVGYSLPRVEVDIICISHEHTDHNNERMVEGHPTVIRGPGKHFVSGMEILGIATYHDKDRGLLRGPNTVFRFSMDGLEICHLGDLGCTLGQAEAKAIGPIDILFVPIGGTYTLDATEAWTVIELLCPRIVIPMHYRTPALSFDLEGVEKVLQGRDFVGPLKSFDPEPDCKAEPRNRGSIVVLLDYLRAVDMDR